MSKRTLESIQNKLGSMAEQSATDLMKFSNDFAINAAYAMEWSDSVYVAAATQSFAVAMTRIITTGTSRVSAEEVVTVVYEDTLRALMSGASSATNKSTGQGANMMDTARIEVAAKFYSWLNMGL